MQAQGIAETATREEMRVKTRGFGEGIERRLTSDGGASVQRQESRNS